MFYKKTTIIGLLCLLAVHMQAQEGNWLTRSLLKVKNLIDSSTVKGIDPRYIGVPSRPWQVVARYNMDQMNLTMNSFVEEDWDDDKFEFDMDSKLRTGTANRIGVWVGYRGYGLGYSVNVGSQRGSYFTTGITGSSYGINLRLRTFSTKDLDVDANIKLGQEHAKAHEAMELPEAIRVRSLIVDGYYLFNGKHFSYTAAYDHSTIQLRSAGSLMVGGMWHHTSIRFDSDANAFFIDMMDRVGCIKIRQGSLGVGYAYNWVPARGLLINALFMPMLTVYNSQKADLYDTYVDEVVDVFDNDRIYYSESFRRNSHVTMTFDARMSITYNWERFYVNACGQWNHYRYSHGDTGNGYLNDWFLNTSLGVRF